MSLTAERFEDFFAALHPGRQAFPWQKRLCREVMQGEWPRTLSLPTASGKTSCIDIALYALAAGITGSPRRILFVVDRRVIVDEAFEHANHIARQLRDATDGILREVANGLCARRGVDPSGDTDPLACFQLRGGTYRDNAWARTPSQPTVICSTVDQVGSRLLFRGYGVSDYLQPLHAGLIANDTLILLDEAHCSNPFRQTLEAIGRYRALATTALPQAPFAYALLSATPRSSDEGSTVASPSFGLDAEDEANDTLGRRLHARKPARLIALDERTATPQFADQLIAQAKALASTGAKRIGIIVNRVRSAQLVFDRLPGTPAQKALFIGRMRPIDRDASMQQWRAVLRSGSTASPDEPVYVVATQCIEVGADLDFDALVTECASLDALRQRFGRLYRLGEPAGVDPLAHPPGVIVIAKDSLKDDDPIYGSALLGTWNWLGEQVDGQACVDFGIAAMKHQLDGGAPAQTLVEAVDAPVLHPAYLDQWVQTSPKPEHEAEPSLFLHGKGTESSDVQVCWRADLYKGKSDGWADVVALCPPSVGECMSVPLVQFRRWMRGEKDMVAADVENVDTPEDAVGDGDSARPDRSVLVWRGDQSFVADNPGKIRPGDTLVIPARQNGWDAFGHVPEAETRSIDLAEQAMLQARWRLVMRVHPDLLDRYPKGPSRQRLADLLDQQTDDTKADPEPGELLDAVSEALAPCADGRETDWRSMAARILRTGKGRSTFRIRKYPATKDGPGKGWFIERRHPLPREAMRNFAETAHLGDFTTEDDSSSFTTVVPLKCHLDGVADFARSYAAACGLPDELVNDIALAASLHDLGKADTRFQSMLRGGAPAFASGSLDGLLAKSNGAQDRRSRDRARDRSGYPKGGRHELLSLKLAQSNAEVKTQAHDLDLVLHLIASHHGRCRPFAPAVEDSQGCEVALADNGHSYGHAGPTGTERIDSGVSDRFWRLVRRYGWWGLSHLEAIHMLADHRRSEFEERTASKSEQETGDGE
jgi:CRISPR-associated endonuclease/helicase Cas3